MVRAVLDRGCIQNLLQCEILPRNLLIYLLWNVLSAVYIASSPGRVVSKITLSHHQLGLGKMIVSVVNWNSLFWGEF